MNTETNSHTETLLYSLSNAHVEPTTPDNEWLKLVAYGDYPHEKGMQVFHQQAAKAIVKQFKSLKGRLSRAFGGVPIFIGHPDDPYFMQKAGHQDTRAYAWIHDLREDVEGLWACVRWSKAGREVLENAFYKFLSPRWLMKSIGSNVFEPMELVSVGLTNRPNIPGDALSNELNAKAQASDCELSDQLKLEIQAKQQLEHTVADLTLHNQTLTTQAETLAAALQAAHAQLKIEQSAKIDWMLQLKLKDGTIRPEHHLHWKQNLEDNYEQALKTLSNARPGCTKKIHTDALTKTLASNTTRSTFIDTVRKRVETTGEPYYSAWSTVKRARPNEFQNS